MPESVLRRAVPSAVTARCSQYLVRFMFEAAKGSPWACTGLDDHSASELPDGEQKLTARRWTNVSELVRYRFRDNRAADSAVLCTQLVLRCANALKRSPSNLHVYVSDTSVSLQLAALGTENVAEVLKLSEKSRPLSDEDSAKLLGHGQPRYAVSQAAWEQRRKSWPLRAPVAGRSRS